MARYYSLDRKYNPLYKVVIYTLAAWTILAGISIFQYQKIIANTCYFQSTFLLCGPTMNTSVKVFLLCGIFCAFSLLIVGGFNLWKSWFGSGLLPSRIAIMGLLCLGLVCMVIPFGTTDMSYYFYSGKAMEEGINVFGGEWINVKDFIFPVTESVQKGFSYGPLTAFMFRVVHFFSFENILVFMLIWKVVMIVFFVLCGWAINKLVNGVESKRLWYVWLLQPLILFEAIVNGHFDIIWIFFTLCAVIFAERCKWHWVVVCLCIGVWAKFIPIITIPWFALWWWQTLSIENWKKEIRNMLLGLCMSVGLTLLLWFRFWTDFSIFETMGSISKWVVNSVFGVLYYSLQPIFKWIFDGNSHWVLTRLVHLTVASVVVYFLYPYIRIVPKLLIRKKTWTSTHFILAIFITMLVYLTLWQKAFWPWYMIWIVPFGMIIANRTKNIFVQKIVRWVSIAPLGYYIIWPLNTVIQGTDATAYLWFNWFMVVSIMVYPLYQLLCWRKTGYALLVDSDNT